MSDALIWLGYLIGAAVAFAAVHSRGWKITPATFVGGVVGLAIWAMAFFAASSDERSPWLQVELALNGSLSLIFAAAGAAVAMALKQRRQE